MTFVPIHATPIGPNARYYEGFSIGDAWESRRRTVVRGVAVQLVRPKWSVNPRLRTTLRHCCLTATAVTGKPRVDTRGRACRHGLAAMQSILCGYPFKRVSEHFISS
jgi:hypothetical protein